MSMTNRVKRPVKAFLGVDRISLRHRYKLFGEKNLLANVQNLECHIHGPDFYRQLMLL